MKLKLLNLFLVAVVLLWACTPKPVITPGPYQLTSEDELFARAEKLFESQSYEEALGLYDEYVRQYPAKSLAAAEKLARVQPDPPCWIAGMRAFRGLRRLGWQK